MTSHRGRWDRPFSNGSTSESDEEPEETTDETSLNDLVDTADVEAFDSTFLIEKSDVPIGVGETFPITQPWEGLPRAAIMFNFNYVWDADDGRWVRQGPSAGEDTGTTEIILPSSETVPGRRLTVTSMDSSLSVL